MATRNFVPRKDGEGSVGKPRKHWGAGYFDHLNLSGRELKVDGVKASRVGEVGSCFFTLVSGLTIMWGSEYNTSTTDGKITFPVSFSSNAFSVAVNVDGGTSATRTVSTKNMTKTGFEYQKTDVQTGIRWIAVGV